jgi:hypothetical protein
MDLEKLLNIPKELNLNPNTSFYNLVNEYYFENFSEFLIRDHLIKNKNYHDYWLSFCTNKRVEKGWVIEEKTLFFYVYYLEGKSKLSLKRFLNKDKAYSYYIYNEIISVYKS